MTLVDSKRLAAFQLGHNLGRLRFLLAAGIEGDILHNGDVHSCLGMIDRSSLVLAEGPNAAEYTNLKPLLQRMGHLHDSTCGIGPPNETLSERKALARSERGVVEQIEFLCRRIARNDSSLGAWYDVGDALARFAHHVFHVYKTVPIPVADWNPLNRAVDRLPVEDRALAATLLRLEHRNLTDLSRCCVDAYCEICQCLSGPDANGEVAVSLEGPASAGGKARETSGSIWQDNGTGFAHTPDYSQCRCGGVTYPLVGVTRALVHALDVLTHEGVTTPFEGELVERAKKLYASDPDVTRSLDGLRDKPLHKVFSRGGAWSSLVLGYKIHGGRKGTYQLNLRPHADSHPGDPT
ncbi:MAG: hypothetical protein BGO49_27680 [Planctomycetales bacterium 71-10]|nr:MAG: hypothetical protein BGO49_27680 [Planctomycetales bacterium 71-10]